MTYPKFSTWCCCTAKMRRTCDMPLSIVLDCIIQPWLQFTTRDWTRAGVQDLPPIHGSVNGSMQMSGGCLDVPSPFDNHQLSLYITGEWRHRAVVVYSSKYACLHLKQICAANLGNHQSPGPQSARIVRRTSTCQQLIANQSLIAFGAREFN